MASVTLSATTQSLINTALTQGAGTNNANYVAAYNAIYDDIKNSGLNAGIINWFSQAGSVNGYQSNPSPSGAYIWGYTKAAGLSEGYTNSGSLGCTRFGRKSTIENETPVCLPISSRSMAR
jgi:hypothetical protein